MNSDQGVFLAAIAAHPQEDTPRLMYADWLDEHDESARAEFIRLQINLARGIDYATGNPLTKKDMKEMSDRADALLETHRTAWENPIRGPEDDRGVERVIWCRGCPEGVCIKWPSALTRFLTHADTVLAAEPTITTLDLRSSLIGSTEMQALAACLHLTKLSSLELSGNRIDRGGVEALVSQTSHLRNLTRLDLFHNNIDAAGALAIARSPHLKKLTYLNLGFNNINAAGAQAIARSPHLQHLTSLKLQNCGIGVGGARALAKSSNMQHLTSLDLVGNGIGMNGVQALAHSQSIPEEATIFVNEFSATSPRAFFGTKTQLHEQLARQQRGVRPSGGNGGHGRS